MIRQDPTVKLHTLKHRYYASQGNAAAADKEKSSCPCFSVAVRFQGGKRKRHICGWTSVGLVDIDHLEKAALPELLKYFCVKSDFAQMTKDDQLRLTEFALICLEEIEELRPEALSRIKAVSTTLIINERRAYGHFKESKPHIASFCGTTNNVNFLTDVSGDRRWFPMEITAIDDPYTHPVNYRGVYAQAYALWKSRFRYWLSSSEVAEVNRRNEYFRAPDLEADQIQTYFRRPLPGEAAVFITTAQIISRISGGIRQLMSPAKVNQLMKKLGFEAVRSGNKRGYLVVELTLDQVNQNRSALGHYLRDECCSES